MLPSNVAVEIILSSECALAKLANEVFRHVWVVSVLMLSQLVFVVKAFAALATNKRLVLFVPQQMRYDLVAIGISLLALAATIRDVLLMIFTMSNHVVQLVVHIRTHYAVMGGLGV